MIRHISSLALLSLLPATLCAEERHEFHMDASAALSYVSGDEYDTSVVELGLEMPIRKPIGMNLRASYGRSDDALGTERYQSMAMLFANDPKLGGLFLTYGEARNENEAMRVEMQNRGLAGKYYLPTMDLAVFRNEVQTRWPHGGETQSDWLKAAVGWYPRENLLLEAYQGFEDMDESYGVYLKYQSHSRSRVTLKLEYAHAQSGDDSTGLTLRYYFGPPKSLKKRIRKAHYDS